MRVTLVIEDMEPELATINKLTRLPIVELRCLPNHKTFNPHLSYLHDVLGRSCLRAYGSGQPMTGLS